MIRGEFDALDDSTPEGMYGAYLARLRTTVETVGVETVVERSGVDRDIVSAVGGGERPELTLEAAAAVLGADPDLPAGDTIAAEARDLLLMGMTTAVVDVDAVAAGVDLDLDPREIQQKVEGRHPMTLVEYAHVHAFLERQ